MSCAGAHPSAIPHQDSGKPMTGAEVRWLRRLAAGRIGLGAFATLGTRLFACFIAGPAASKDEVAKLAGRLYGIREIAVAALMIDALNRRRDVAPNLTIDLCIDVSDAAFVYIARRALPTRGRVAGIGIGAGYALLELWIKYRLALNARR
jgi:hypothetical protein